MAPATAPTGPSTSAPDKAPSAASPVRSWAIAAEDISVKEIVTIAIVFFIQEPRIDVIRFSSHLFLKACEFGLEGLVLSIETGHTALAVRSIGLRTGSIRR